MRLFHFSDDPEIAVFVPRPVLVPTVRPAGREWLNGPLVWAIDEIHQPMYLFPRDCPRILLWPTPDTTAEDYAQWWGGSSRRVIAYIERVWLDRLRDAVLHRYELPITSFEDIRDAGMWVSKTQVVPTGIETLRDLPAELRAQDVELRVTESLVPLKNAWRTSLHASGIRLRNARGWEASVNAR
jgi:hypothetical protein